VLDLGVDPDVMASVVDHLGASDSVPDAGPAPTGAVQVHAYQPVDATRSGAGKAAFVPVPDPVPPPTTWHGGVTVGLIAALSPGADVDVIEIRNAATGADPREFAASWVDFALHQFRDCDLVNLSVAVDRGGLYYAPHFEMAVANTLESHAETRPVVVVAAAALSDARTVAPLDLIDPRPAEPEPAPMTYPARNRYVVAIGALNARGQPWSGNGTRGKEGPLHWLMPGGDEAEPLGSVELTRSPSQPLASMYGTSFATALFTGQLASCLARSNVRTRVQTLSIAESETVRAPQGSDPVMWGRGTLGYDPQS
jgi:hypothetical protein